MRRILNFITQYSIYLVVFLVPLAFAPWTFEAFEFNKLTILFFLVTIGTLAWFARMVFVDREIRFKRTPLDLPIVLFATLTNISSFFSSDHWSSVFGYYGRFSDSATAVGSFVGLYFLIINTVEKPRKVLWWFLGAVGIALATNYLAVFHVWEKLPVWQVMAQAGFHTMGAAIEGFAVFLSAITVFLVFQIVRQQPRILSLAAQLALIAGSLGILLLADVSKAWIVLMLGLLFVLVAGGGIRKLILPFGMLLVAVVFLFSFVSLRTVIPQAPEEFMLSQGLSWSIAWNTATESVKTMLIGSGPGTFAIDFLQHKPESFNMQAYFDRSGSYLSELLATYGFLGLFAYLLIGGFFIFASWFLIAKKNMPPFFIAVVSILIAQAVYYQTLSLGLAFWLFLALGVLAWERPVKEFVFSLRKFSEFEVAAKAIFCIVLASAGWAGYFAVRFYGADMAYKAAQNIQRTDTAKSIEKGVEAAQMNPYQAEYKMFVGRSYLSRALSELQKPESERDQEIISQDVQFAIAYAKEASEVSPKRAEAWKTLGAVYRDIPFAAGAQDWAARSFETAIALEPTNPVLRTELGKLYVASEQYDKARMQFERAAALQPDYVEAQMQLALILEKEKDMEGALAKMKDIALRYPLDAESLFQLGRLQYNNGQVEEAIVQFRQILRLIPSHSNARFALGAALEKQGKTEEAIQEFEKVLELNPGSEQVMRKLQELKK